MSLNHANMRVSTTQLGPSGTSRRSMARSVIGTPTSNGPKASAKARNAAVSMLPRRMSVTMSAIGREERQDGQRDARVEAKVQRERRRGGHADADDARRQIAAVRHREELPRADEHDGEHQQIKPPRRPAIEKQQDQGHADGSRREPNDEVRGGGVAIPRSLPKYHVAPPEGECRARSHTPRDPTRSEADDATLTPTPLSGGVAATGGTAATRPGVGCGATRPKRRSRAW